MEGLCGDGFVGICSVWWARKAEAQRDHPRSVGLTGFPGNSFMFQNH